MSYIYGEPSTDTYFSHVRQASFLSLGTVTWIH
jgi:hypothetical protein